MDWLSRYQAGDREQVWHELRQLGDRVREPQYLEHAQAVCDEMARRARRNIEILTERLRAMGYQFHSTDFKDEPVPVEPHFEPSPNVDTLLEQIDAELGPIPLAMKSWARIVGDVWFVGAAPTWPEAPSADPLVIQIEWCLYGDEDVMAAYRNEYSVWLNEREENPDERYLFVLPVSPDRVMKANFSGGPPYGFVLPDRSVEGLFSAEVPIPFVAYLNHVFSNGGFSERPPFDIHQVLTAELAPL